MKTAFIVNPIAGRGRTAKIWEDLKRTPLIIAEKGETFFTKGPGDAKTLAEELAQQGFNRFLVFGGDGTVNEVINGLNSNDLELGVIPTGTGNDFCRQIGIPKKPKEALERLLQGRSKAIDLGVVNGRRFLNILGVGFDAEVAKTVNELYQNLTGIRAYLAAVLKVLREYRNGQITIETETATINGKMFLVAIGNGSYIGGGMKIVPQAKIDDGLFHLCLIGDVSKPDVLVNIGKIFTGSHLTHPKVSSLTAKKIKIASTKPMTVQADGEILGTTPVEIELLPKALRILVP